MILKNHKTLGGAPTAACIQARDYYSVSGSSSPDCWRANNSA